MHSHSQLRLWHLCLVALGGVLLYLLLLHPASVRAVSRITTVINQASANGSGTTVSTPISSTTSGNVLVVICGSKVSTTLSVSAPTGFSTAISQSGVPSQAIFYKIALGGETTATCSFGTSGRVSIQVYELTWLIKPITGVLTSSSSGTGTAYASGSLTTTAHDSLLLSSFFVNTASNTPSWSNSFSTLQNGGVSSGPSGNRFAYGGAYQVVASAGTYTTTASGSGSGAWRGQIVAFKSDSTIFSLDIVDAGGVPVASPTVNFSPLASSFSCQTATATLGTSTQRIRVTNNTDAPQWSLGLAATGGPSALWSGSGQTYDFNNPAGSGCTNGQLSVDPTSGSVTGIGCTTFGISLGTSSSFNDGVVDSMTLASAGPLTAVEDCAWDITNIPLSQKIPAEQKPNNYSLNLTLTLVAT